MALRTAGSTRFPESCQSDDELVDLLDSPDLEVADLVLATLQKRHGRRVYKRILGLVGDAHLAQDVAQETLLRLYTKRHLYRPGTYFRAWLLEIARKAAFSALRRQRRLPRPTEEQELLRSRDLESEPEQGLEEAETMAAFRRAVRDLPAPYRRVFELCVVDGQPYRDVARLLDLPIGTVAIRLMRARQRLYRHLAPHLGRVRRPPACVQGR